MLEKIREFLLGRGGCAKIEEIVSKLGISRDLVIKLLEDSNEFKSLLPGMYCLKDVAGVEDDVTLA